MGDPVHSIGSVGEGVAPLGTDTSFSPSQEQQELLEKAQEIISNFRKEENVTLLGRLTKVELEDKARVSLIIKQKNKTFNEHLAKLSSMVGCKEKITGYVFRYTWANLAKQCGYSRDLIAEALGHEYGNRVTGIYLQGYDLELVDEMNERIISAITA